MNDAPDWVDQARRLVTGLGQTLGSALGESDADGAHPDDCRWCPVCQVAAVVRGERPEVTNALADVLTAAAAALRTAAERASAPAPEAGAEQPAPEAGAEQPAPPAAPVQHIEIA
jgi:nucleoid-associated protein YgaU